MRLQELSIDSVLYLQNGIEQQRRRTEPSTVTSSEKKKEEANQLLYDLISATIEEGMSILEWRVETVFREKLRVA